MGDYYGRENDGSGEGMSNPMTAAGDLIIGGEAGNPERLGVGSNGQVLTASPSGPVWAGSPTLVTPALGTPASGEMCNCSDLSEAENLSSIIQYPIPTSSYMLKAASDGSPTTATNTDSDVADAVSKKHTQHTDTGTTATSFKINTGGNEADIQTTGLTGDRDYTFPDIDTKLAGSVLTAQNIIEIIEYTA